MSSDRKLTRSMDGKMIGGVCVGLANYFGIDITLVRLMFGIVVLLGAGSPLLLYLLLWVIMPVEGSARAMGNTTPPAAAPQAPEAPDEGPAE